MAEKFEEMTAARPGKQKTAPLGTNQTHEDTAHGRGAAGKPPPRCQENSPKKMCPGCP